MIRPSLVLIHVVDGIIRRPGWVAGMALVLTGLALSLTIQGLRIDTSATEMLSPEVPFRRHEAAYRDAFPAFTETVVAVVGGRGPERVEQAAAALAEALRADPHFTAVAHPEGEPFFTRHGLLFLDIDDLAEVSDRLAEAQPLLAALSEAPDLRGLAGFVELVSAHGGGEAGGELAPLLEQMAEVVEAQLAGVPGELSWRRVLDGGAADRPVRAVIVAEPVYDHGGFAPAAAAIEAVRTLAHDLGIDPEHGLSLDLTGGAVLAQEELVSVSTGTLLAGGLTTLAVSVLLILGLRSWRLIVATLVTLGAGLILTAGFATLAIGRLNLISVSFAVLFVGLGVDFGIHMALRYREELNRTGAHATGLRLAVAGLAGALTMSALAAALGFLAFVPTDYQGLAELGTISAAGMAIAWSTSLTLMPALLSLLPLAPQPGGAETAGPTGAAPARQRFGGLLLIVAGLAAVGSASLLPAVRFDFNPLNLKDPESESVRTFQALAADGATSPHVIEAVAGSLDAADALALRVAALPEVGEAITLTRFVPEGQDDKLALIDDLAFLIGPALEPGARPPASADARRAAVERLRAALAGAGTEGGEVSDGHARLAGALDRLAAGGDADLAELEARLTGTLPDLLDRLRAGLEAGPIELADLPARLRVQWLSADGRARLVVRPAGPIADNEALAGFTRAVLAVAPEATGGPVVALAAGDAVVEAFARASWLALVAITLLLALVLRRLDDVALVLLPLGLAVVLTGATAVILDLALNFANVIVLPLLLGLGVSGAIHVVVRHRVEAGRRPVSATATPRAVMFSALTTVASFGSLATSSHPGLASMGLLLTIAILWSLVCTLVVLPGLLDLLDGIRARRTTT